MVNKIKMIGKLLNVVRRHVLKGVWRALQPFTHSELMMKWNEVCEKNCAIN